MVTATVTYKINQNNGVITGYKTENVKGETYDEFLSKVEKEMDRLSKKLGRKIQIDVGKLKRNSIEDREVLNDKDLEKLGENIKDESTTSKLSTDMLSKEAIEHIENTPIEELDGFIPDDEDRVTVIRAMENKSK